MLEKLGQPKTHLELKRMMSEVTGEASKDTISYHDFLNMMLGKRNAILKLWVQIPATLKRLWVASNYKLMNKFIWKVRKRNVHPSIHFLHLLYPPLGRRSLLEPIPGVNVSYCLTLWLDVFFTKGSWCLKVWGRSRSQKMWVHHVAKPFQTCPECDSNRRKDTTMYKHKLKKNVQFS